ncbi:hypothetical protein FGO68_gene17080 [Halteria grandinella]|uniref:Uncharacterized protein n=1 Tax=Halteria grandinella TaxID=5974 RepID=A0A8J8P2Q6_HALGN|nr:hypothetical protein FGO68_gene17080 [Halteria grandinella]
MWLGSQLSEAPQRQCQLLLRSEQKVELATVEVSPCFQIDQGQTWSWQLFQKLFDSSHSPFSQSYSQIYYSYQAKCMFITGSRVSLPPLELLLWMGWFSVMD